MAVTPSLATPHPSRSVAFTRIMPCCPTVRSTEVGLFGRTSWAYPGGDAHRRCSPAIRERPYAVRRHLLGRATDPPHGYLPRIPPPGRRRPAEARRRELPYRGVFRRARIRRRRRRHRRTHSTRTGVRHRHRLAPAPDRRRSAGARASVGHAV